MIGCYPILTVERDEDQFVVADDTDVTLAYGVGDSIYDALVDFLISQDEWIYFNNQLLWETLWLPN